MTMNPTGFEFFNFTQDLHQIQYLGSRGSLFEPMEMKNGKLICLGHVLLKSLLELLFPEFVKRSYSVPKLFWEL